MRFFNKTKNVLVSDDVLALETFREKSDGMRAFNEPRAVYFETRWGVHTLGMKFPIDVAILNKDGKVVALQKDMKPNKFFFWNPKYKRVLELSVESGIDVRDGLELISED